MTLPFGGPDPRPARGFRLWERLSAPFAPPPPEPELTVGQSKTLSELFPEAAARAKLPLSVRVGHLLTPPTPARDAASTTLDAPPPYVPQLPGVRAAPDRSLRELQPVAPREGPEAIRMLAHGMNAGLGGLPGKIVSPLLDDQTRRELDADAGLLFREHDFLMPALAMATNLRGFKRAEQLGLPLLRRGAQGLVAADQASRGALTMMGATGAAGLGGLTGAAMDEEHPWRGGLLGAVGGAGAVFGGRALLGGLPRAAEVGTAVGSDRALLQSIPIADFDVQHLLGSGRARAGLGRRGVVGVEQVPHAPGNVKLPNDEMFEAAVRNTPGASITANGLRIAIERFQKGHLGMGGEESVRSGVMYLPAGDPARKYYRPKRGTAETMQTYGGFEHITGETLIQRPLVVRGGTGGKVGERALVQLLGKDRAKELGDDISNLIGTYYYNSRARDAGRTVQVREFLQKWGANPDLAETIVQNSQQGNQLRYALQENVLAHAARAAGHDAVLGFSSGKTRRAFLSEVFDVRESHYPVQDELGVLHPEFEQRYKNLRLPPAITASTAEAEAMRSASAGSTIAEGLTKDEAVGRMRGLPPDVRAEMRRQPDGTFNIVRRGEAQVQAKPVKPAPLPAPVVRTRGQQLLDAAQARFGSAEEGGFQSRLMTAFEQGGHAMARPMSLDEWVERLTADPNIPEAELAAIFGDPKHRDLGRAHEYIENINGGDRDAHHAVSADDMLGFLWDASPATGIETTARSAEGGRQITEYDLRQEAEHLAEQDREVWNDELDYSLRRLRNQLQMIQEGLAGTFGPVGAERYTNLLRDRFYTDPDEIRAKAAEGKLFTDDETGEDSDVGPSMNDVHDWVQGLMPNHMQLAIPGTRPEVPDVDRIQTRTLLGHAIENHDEALRFARLIADDDHDWSELEERARESLEENGGVSADRGDTEYSTYQRVDESAPYREVLVHLPGSGIRAGHFNKPEGLMAHARGEIHDKTWLMIEGQSDVAKQIRQGAKRGHTSPAAQRVAPFVPTERWAKLSVGASLVQAAKEGLDYFAWVSPRNRVDAANLNPESAKITYGKAVPGAVEQIFEQLGLEAEYSRASFDGEHGGVFDRVRLTPKVRALILKAGIPALGIAGLAITAREKAPD